MLWTIEFAGGDNDMKLEFIIEVIDIDDLMIGRDLITRTYYFISRMCFFFEVTKQIAPSIQTCCPPFQGSHYSQARMRRIKWHASSSYSACHHRSSLNRASAPRTLSAAKGFHGTARLPHWLMAPPFLVEVGASRIWRCIKTLIWSSHLQRGNYKTYYQ